MSKTKDGVKVTLVLHPHDDQTAINELFGHPVGQRYMVALVPVDAENQPVIRKDKSDGERAVVSAAMLCRDPRFQKWAYDKGHTIDMDDDSTADYICRACAISSRAELKDNLNAREAFNAIRLQFAKDEGGLP